MTWQDIKSAPKDGTRILAYDPAWSRWPSVMTWEDITGAGYWDACDDVEDYAGRGLHPTHWQPLPDPPKDIP